MVAIDMEMPKSCYNCGFVTNLKTNDYGSFCECGILQDYETINLLEHSKHPDCPLKEIVTCKYCKHSRTCVIEEKTHRFCNCEKHRLQEVADDYFCGDGERKE
jgi:hypothetical protein